MSRRFLEMSAHAIVALALSSIPTLSAGQGCTEDDRAQVAVAEHAAIHRLQNQDLAGYQEVLESLDSELSASCRAQLNRMFPARTRCTSAEKDVAMLRLRRAFTAAAAGEIGRTLDALSSIQDDVSEECWLALNYPTHPKVQATCDGDERAFLARASGPALEALEALYHSGDPDPAINVASAMVSHVSAECLAAVREANAPPDGGSASPGPSPAPPAVSNVYDHGGGTYSMPGVGACTPTGCMAF